MTSQSRDEALKGLVYIDPNTSVAHASLSPNVQYSVADDDTDKKLKKLEGDINFLRGMLIDIYSKCPKMTHEFNGDKKKRKKNDTVDCENCGGLLW